MPSPASPPRIYVELVAENLHAVQAIYFAWQVEQMRAFQVVDRIVELFQRGLLPLGPGSAADALEHYYSTRPGERLTARERADLYRRALGVPGGDREEVEPNLEFDELWLRFVSSVSLYVRQCAIEEILTPPTPASARVVDTARALAVNASRHGAGLAAPARRLSAEVRERLALLREPEIKHAFGARDLWHVIDAVNTRELGGAVDVTRYRTRAQAGSVMLHWLAAHADALVNPQSDAAPGPADLLQAVEQWIAVSGVQDAAVEGQSQPTESPAAPPPPIDLPAIVEDLLRELGLASSRSQRVVALFHGANGTARALVAFAIAEFLGVELLRIDLCRVVSKYIGDTEKNLDAVFARAEASDAFVLFDEADALFGKRSEVPDAHDRYAKAQLGYLLQRIESHGGVVIMASNRPPDIDDATLAERWRRLRCRAVRFPGRRSAEECTLQSGSFAAFPINALRGSHPAARKETTCPCLGRWMSVGSVIAALGLTFSIDAGAATVTGPRAPHRPRSSTSARGNSSARRTTSSSWKPTRPSTRSRTAPHR